MEMSCGYIERMLVDYADGRLSAGESRQVAEHLASCEGCRAMLDALGRSLELAGVIWQDGLAEAEGISIGRRKAGGRAWRRYAAAAAGIIVIFAASVLWLAEKKGPKQEMSFGEIERSIVDAGGAARLLAVTERLARYADAGALVKRQYQHIIDEYPNTAAAAEARRRMQ